MSAAIPVDLRAPGGALRVWWRPPPPGRRGCVTGACHRTRAQQGTLCELMQLALDG